MNLSRFIPCALACGFALTLSNSSYGYIDGGTGSLLLQATISGILGGIFVFRSFFKELFARFRRKPEEPSSSIQEERKAA